MYKTKIDKEGRVYIPSKVRKNLDINENGWVNLESTDDEIIITKCRSPVEGAYGIFKRKKEEMIHEN